MARIRGPRRPKRGADKLIRYEIIRRDELGRVASLEGIKAGTSDLKRPNRGQKLVKRYEIITRDKLGRFVSVPKRLVVKETAHELIIRHGGRLLRIEKEPPFSSTKKLTASAAQRKGTGSGGPRKKS